MKDKKDKTIEELKKEWQAKYGEGNCRELTSEGKSVYVFDPTVDLNKIKIIFAARRKSVSDMVDALLNNCWLGGDETLKKDDAFKLGIEEQVDEMIEFLEPIEEKLESGNLKVTVDGKPIELRKATRIDVRYAEDRNPERKPLVTAQFLLERIAVNTSELDDMRKNAKAYVALLLYVFELKDKKHVEIKKF